MTPEEKARAYDEALDRARKLYNGEETSGDVEIACEIIFPELLKEFEDEKIRKALLNYLKKMWGNCKDNVCGIHVEDAIAWLEKQGEQKTYSWKPTEEQFEALDYAYNSCPDTERGNYYEGILETLIKDLHKLEKQGETFTKKDVDDAYLKGVSDTKNELEKQGEKPQGKSALETWKIMRFEVYQQASGNRHEPNCSDDTTKMFSLNDIDEIFERIAETCEEQGEQKPILDFKAKDWYVSEADGKIRNIYHSVDKAEPRFQEGDFIVGPYCRGKIIALTSDAYLLDTGQGIPFSCKDNVHLWTIEDAKDGDVLKEDSCTFIIERMKPDKTAIIHCCLFDDGDFELGSTLSFDVDSTYPAAKEQRDLLFQKIKEAGYEWDSEKKELKKIDDEEVNGEDYGIDGFWHAKRILEKTLGSVSGYQTDDGILDHKAAITAVKKLYEQKTTWSEEDEKKLSDILAILRGGENCYYNSPILMDWLKSLKNRVIPQSKQEWSEEDESIKQWIISDIEKLFSLDKKSSIISNIEIDWLKSLKERIGG